MSRPWWHAVAPHCPPVLLPGSADLPRFRLDNGLHVALRPIRPADADALHHAFARLSPETRYQRFHAVLGELTPAMLDYLTRVDAVRHVAWVALSGSDIVGVARFVQRGHLPVAEVAFVVADEVQGLGVGALLRDQLVAEARARGITAFEANVLPGNRAIRGLLSAPGLELQRDTGHELHIALTPLRPSQRMPTGPRSAQSTPLPI